MELLTALLLSLPVTGAWGIALAATIKFATVVFLLDRCEYVYAMINIAIFAALFAHSVWYLILLK